MATKSVDIDGIGQVDVYKRKGAANIRISIDSSGKVRVTQPTWVPFRVGVEFAKTKRDWILTHRRPVRLIEDGTSLGKSHHFEFVSTEKPRASSRIQLGAVRISVPNGSQWSDAHIQMLARKAGMRALRFEAEKLLPIRLSELAQTHGFSYASVTIRALKGRWGSCSQHREIVLNMYLMQLSWELIDYVLLHELTHTRIMAHGKPFWDEMSKYVKDLPRIRKEMRSHQPKI